MTWSHNGMAFLVEPTAPAKIPAFAPQQVRRLNTIEPADLTREQVDEIYRRAMQAAIAIVSEAFNDALALAAKEGHAGLIDAAEKLTKAPPTMLAISQAVAARYKVEMRDIMSERRTANIIEPRQVLFFVARRHTLRSLPQIGKYVGNRDHTTVLHGAEKIKARLASGNFPDLAEHVKAIEAAVL